MDNLLTAQQVEELLKVNRITVYRMLQDGRLKGVKIGQQWRFPAAQFEKLATGSPLVSEVPAEPDRKQSLPVHCLQTIQTLFASMGKVSTLIVDPLGEPITEIDQPTEFINILFQIENGRNVCLETWKQAVLMPQPAGWIVCQPGYSCYKLPIKCDDEIVAYILLGQFSSPNGYKAGLEMIEGLAGRYSIDPKVLIQKFQELPVLDESLRLQVEVWGSELVKAIESILIERSNLLGRLHRIVEIGSV